MAVRIVFVQIEYFCSVNAADVIYGSTEKSNKSPYTEIQYCSCLHHCETVCATPVVNSLRPMLNAHPKKICGIYDE